MELEIGGTYEIINNVGKRWVIRVNNENEKVYNVLVLESADSDMVNYNGTVGKTSMLLRESTITRLDKPLEELVKLQNAYGDEKPKKRRTAVEIEIDNLIEYVQLTIKFNETWELVNLALDNKNYEAFVQLSKEYAKVKKQRRDLREKVKVS